MLYISDIFNVDTKEHYDRIKSFTQAQMMYCVELRDFTTGEQRAMCMPKVVVAEEIIPFGVVAGGYLCVLDKMFVKLLDNIDTEIISTIPEDTQAFDCIKFYDIILSNKGVVSQDGSLILNSLYSTLEIVFDVDDYDYLNKLIIKHHILNQHK